MLPCCVIYLLGPRSRILAISLAFHTFSSTVIWLNTWKNWNSNLVLLQITRSWLKSWQLKDGRPLKVAFRKMLGTDGWVFWWFPFLPLYFYKVNPKLSLLLCNGPVVFEERDSVEWESLLSEFFAVAALTAKNNTAVRHLHVCLHHSNFRLSTRGRRTNKNENFPMLVDSHGVNFFWYRLNKFPAFYAKAL